MPYIFFCIFLSSIINYHYLKSNLFLIKTFLILNTSKRPLIYYNTYVGRTGFYCFTYNGSPKQQKIIKNTKKYGTDQAHYEIFWGTSKLAWYLMPAEFVRSCCDK